MPNKHYEMVTPAGDFIDIMKKADGGWELWMKNHDLPYHMVRHPVYLSDSSMQEIADVINKEHKDIGHEFTKLSDLTGPCDTCVSRQKGWDETKEELERTIRFNEETIDVMREEYRHLKKGYRDLFGKALAGGVKLRGIKEVLDKYYRTDPAGQPVVFDGTSATNLQTILVVESEYQRLIELRHDLEEILNGA